MTLLYLLAVLLVFCVVAWAARTIMAVFGAPAQLQTLVTVAIVLIAVFWFLGQIAGVGPALRIR